MLNPLRQVFPGDPAARSAGRENALTAAAHFVQQQQRSYGGGVQVFDLKAGMVLVRNDTNADQDKLAVLGINDLVFQPATYPAEFQRVPGVVGVVPTADHAGKFVILARPLPKTAFGVALVAGVTAVKINMLSATHKYADVKAGDCTQLESTDSGTARILAVEAGTGTRWAYVRLGGGGGGGGGSTYPIVDVICAKKIPAKSMAIALSPNNHGGYCLLGEPTGNDDPALWVWVPNEVPAYTLVKGGGRYDWNWADVIAAGNLFPGDIASTVAGSWQLGPGLVGAKVVSPITGSISRLNITSATTGHGQIVTVDPPGSGGTQAVAIADIVNGCISGYRVKIPGSGYVGTSVPVTIAPPASGGVQATAVGVIVAGSLVSIIGLNPGSKYGPAVTIAAPASGGRQATALPSVTDDTLSDAALLDSGYGYTTQPQVTVAGGASVEAIVAGSVDAVVPGTQGEGYQTAPTAVVDAPDDPNGVRATCTPQMSGGKVAGYLVTGRGWGYVKPPGVTLAGGSPTTTATAIASIA